MGQYEKVTQSEVNTVDVDEVRTTSRWRSWRVTVFVGALASSAVLLLNAGVLAWSLREFAVVDGIATVYQGDCVVAARINTFGHLAINVLSTLLLSASNNCAQLLNAPSRHDIIAAHKQGIWLDIGVPSLRNLIRVPFWRSSLWTVVMLSSLPLHLLYNSVLFNTIAFREVVLQVVTEDFVSGGWWNETREALSLDPEYAAIGLQTMHHLQQQAMMGSLQELNTQQCLTAYSDSGFANRDFVYGNALLVTSLIHNDSIIYGEFHEVNWRDDPPEYRTTPLTGKQNASIAAAWTADLPVTYDLPNDWREIDAHLFYLDENSVDRPWTTTWVTTPIIRCLAEKNTQKCTTRVETRFLAIVVVCNLVKMIGLLVVSFGRSNPLATMGDAIAYFLASPDQTIFAQGPMSFSDAKHGLVTGKSAVKLYHRRVLRWWHAANTQWIGRLVVCLVLSLALCAYASVLLHSAIGSSSTDVGSDGIKFNLLASPVNAPTIPFLDSASLTTSALLPNVPQVLVSFAYLLYNNALTSMLIAYEFSAFASNRKSLRVTSPTGQQRSTYWLQLPYRYAIPLMVGMAVLHWLISRSIFLVQIEHYDYYGNNRLVGNGCGYSWSALALALGLGVVFVLAIIGLSLRKLDPGVPLAGSCSIAISAACSAACSAVQEEGAATMTLQYGVLLSRPCDSEGRRYVGFSSKEVGPLEDGVEYL